MKSFFLFYFLFCQIACATPEATPPEIAESQIPVADTIPASTNRPVLNRTSRLQKDQTTNKVAGKELVAYARTLMGIPYKYASSTPSTGFDCSGFITYVFNHFDVEVPRTSRDFTPIGKEIDKAAAREGDLILFTGTVPSIRTVGHMGIVTENTDSLRFIHSTSGRANGVTVTALNKHYQQRFVKVIRVLEE